MEIGWTTTIDPSTANLADLPVSCILAKGLCSGKVAARVYLAQLASYAPELNSDEGTWHYLKNVELKNVLPQPG